MIGQLKIWSAIVILLLLFTPFTASEKRLQSIASHELSLMERALGRAGTNAIVTQTNAVYDDLFVKTGVLGGLRKSTTHEEDRMSAGSNLGSAFYHFTTAMNNYLLGFITLMYLSLLRLIMLIQWAPFLVPFIVAAIIDGMTQHKILHESVMVSNPVKFKWATQLLMIGLALPVVYLFSPMAITPYFILGWAVVMALPLMSVVAQLAPLSYK